MAYCIWMYYAINIIIYYIIIILLLIIVIFNGLESFSYNSISLLGYMHSYLFVCLFFNYLFIYILFIFFLAVLGLRFCARASSSCGERGPLFIAVCWPLTVAASLVVEHKLQMRRLSSCGSRA